MVDSSGSIRDSNPTDGSYDNYDLVKDFIKLMVDQLNIGAFDTRVGLTYFSNTGRNHFFLNTSFDGEEIKQRVDVLP